VRAPGGGGTAGAGWQLIDYKTTAEQRLRSQTRLRLEDTQLAFYAALMAAESEGDDAAPPLLSAVYVALDGRDGVRVVEHADVAASARQLVAGLGRDYDQLRAGAPLRALGEGRVCDACDARGLCRRDHWSSAA